MELLQQCSLVPSPQGDRTQFAFMVREFVSCFYPGTEATFGLRLFDEHIAGLRDGAGARRQVWAIRDGRESVGFLVATLRLDCSVKLGPVVVEPGRRSYGHMLGALEEIATVYEAEGRPFLYATYPETNNIVRRLAHYAGWDIAGAVRGLYRDDEEILVHRVLSKETIAASVFAHQYHTSQNRLVRKRGGSILLRVDEHDSINQIGLEGRSAALAVRPINRVCFSRVTPNLATPLDADELVQLVDGSYLAVWR